MTRDPAQHLGELGARRLLRERRDEVGLPPHVELRLERGDARALGRERGALVRELGLGLAAARLRDTRHDTRRDTRRDTRELGLGLAAARLRDTRHNTRRDTRHDTRELGLGLATARLRDTP